MCRHLTRNDVKRTNSILCAKFRTPEFDALANSMGLKPEHLTVMDCITLCQTGAALRGSLGATKWLQEQARGANDRRSEAEIKYLEAKTRATEKMAMDDLPKEPVKIEIVGWDTNDGEEEENGNDNTK